MARRFSSKKSAQAWLNKTYRLYSPILRDVKVKPHHFHSMIKKPIQPEHSVGCELGSNWKDCPACLENHFISPKKTLTNKPKKPIIKSIMSKVISFPLQLKRGCIYRVVGGSVAKFLSMVTPDYASFRVHGGKPFVVEIERVRFAEKDDVKHYLADSAKTKRD